jgi:integrase
LNNFKVDQQKEIPQKPISFSKFKTEYEQFVKTSFSESYLRNVRSSLTQMEKYAGDIRLNVINLRVLESFLLCVFSRSKHSAFLCYRNLRAAFNKAIEWNYLVENPFRKFRFPKLPKVYPAFISEAEFEKILEKVKTYLLKDVYTTLFYTGMRAGELVNLKWSDINLESKTITVRNTIEFSTKGKKDRIIPINEKLLRVLQNRFPKVISLNKPQFVFERIPGIKLTIDYLSKHFKKAVRASKMKDNIHLHSLRHSFASNLAQKGVSLYVIRELLGHEDIKTTQIYSHLQHQNLLDAVNLLN